MAPLERVETEHVEGSAAHEAALTGAVALANLFNNCVEAFGLIHPSHKGLKEEQLLLSRLGLQQARLLIWGDIVGISSPPKTVTDRAVPRHPSSAYPDLSEPTFFHARDDRLEDPETRTAIENALSQIVDRSSYQTREEMMKKYGLKPPKKMATEYEPALDINRLEAFREKYELLQEVAESYARINTRRSNSIIQTSWAIADFAKFASFITLTQEKVDFLINLMGVKEGVDRGMRMDIRGFGWHLSVDRVRTAADFQKLRLILEACKDEYPEYVQATEQALANIDRETRENARSPEAYAKAMGMTEKQTPAATQPHTTHANGHGEAHKRPGLLGGIFRSFRSKSHTGEIANKASSGRSYSVSSTGSAGAPEPERSYSDAGPLRRDSASADSDRAFEPIRSKSVGDILQAPVNDVDEDILANNLARLNTAATVKEPLSSTDEISSTVSRHDQYHGIARTATKDLRQW